MNSKKAHTMKTNSPVLLPYLRNHRRILSASICTFLAISATSSQAVISIGGGAVTLDFATAPVSGDWSTITAGLGALDSTYTNIAQLDAGVQTLTAAGIPNTLPTSATSAPPSQNAAGRYNTTLQLLQTRPNTTTAGGAAVILGRLQNSNAVGITNLAVDFLRGVFNNGAAEQIDGQRVYFSLTGLANSWTNIAGLNGATAGTISSSFATTGWGAGGNAFLLFVDDNNTNAVADNVFTIDNLVFTPTLQVVGGARVWNLTHSVGGTAPNGNMEVSANQYWLDGANPIGFATDDIATFSQNPGVGVTATINVTANIAVGGFNVSHSDGTYSIGGAGSISGSGLTKTGTGTLALTSNNGFSATNFSGGGKIVTSSVSALGSGTLTVDAGGGTIETTSDLTTGGLSGAGTLTKTGSAALGLAGTGTGTAGIIVSEGKLRLDTATAIGNTVGVTLANNTTLEYNGAAGSSMTFNSPTVTRVLATGANTVTIGNNVVATNQALIFDATDGITGSGTINKEGVGVVRVTKAHAGLTANWVLNAGVIEATGANTALGSGTVSVNPTGVLVANSIDLQNSVTLAGGALGTRTNSNANFAGPVNVTVDSLINLKSSSSPAGFQGFGISGLLTGSNKLTLTGAVPLIANVNPATALTLKNPGNTYSGIINVTSQTFLANAVTAGTGSALGTGTINLQGGTFRALDNSTGDNTTVVYGNNVTVNAPSEIGALAGVGTIHVERQAVPGTAVNNTIGLGTLGIAGGQTLRVTGANGYAARFGGAATITSAGDATFDTTTANLTLAGGFSGTGGLIKTGAGTLSIVGSAAHTANTTVNAGILDVTAAVAFTVSTGQTLSGTGSVTGGVSVGGGGIVAPGNAIGVGTLTLSNLSLGTASLNYAWNAGTVGSVVVTGTDTLALTGAANSVTLNFANQNPNVGLHTLVDYTGTPLADLTAFTIGSLFSRIQASLVNNTVDTRVELNVTGLNFPIWSGATSTEWSTNVLGAPKNWKLNSDNSNTDFITSDRVVFNDTAVAAAPTVDVSIADVSPSSVEVDSTKNYTFTGTAAIAGTTGLTKAGTGTLTVSSTNSFTGAVNLNAGVTSVATVADSAVNSPLGAGTTVNFGGGTLEFTGATGSTNRGVAVAVGGGTVSVPTGTTLTLAGVVSGAGTLAKSGAGTVVLTAGTNTVAGYTVSQGTLQVGDGTVAGSLGTGAITNDATLAFNTPAAGLIVGNVISGTGSVTKTGPGNVTFNGAVANTYSGDTTVSGGGLVLSNPDGINSVGGNIIVQTGGTVAYGTTAGQRANHIPDTAAITVNGGTFGSGAGNTEAAPQAGIFDTVGSVTLNSGTFLSGRGDASVFTVAGAFNATGGRAFLQRGGSVSADSVSLATGVILDMDGGSTGFTSRLVVGTTGINIAGATINMNTGTNVTAGSFGSSIVLNGNLTSSGATTLSRISTQAAPRANIDLNGADRIFNVTDTMTLGTTTAKVDIVNTGATAADLIKQGTGNLVLAGTNTYNGDTDILNGTLTLTGTLSGSANINVATGTTFDVAGAAGYTVGATQTIKGNGSVVGSATIDGTLAPGSSIGTLNFANNVTFGATGIGAFEINKTGVTLTADLANITGGLTLAGTLNVTATGDALIEGDTFNLFDAASFAGTMAMGTMPTLDPGLFWDITDLGVDGTISVIPEPGSAALLVLGSTLLFRRRRKA